MLETIKINSSLKLPIIVTASIVGLIAFRQLRVRSWGLCRSKKSLKGQVVIITGANSGLGKASAIELAARGARIILACRDVQKGQDTVKEILRRVPTCSEDDLIVLHLDLASFSSVRRFVEEFRRNNPSLNILINNAGVMACNYELTVDNIETQMSVNHYGTFLLTNLLLNVLKESSPSRIIFVTSMLAQKGNIILPNVDKSQYNKREAYANSKLANYIYALELGKRLGLDNGIDIFLVSPGHVWTNLGRHLKPSWWKILLTWPILIPLAYLYVRTPFQGCQNIVYCALEDGLESGEFYRNCKKLMHPKNIIKHQKMAGQLWNHSALVTAENEK